jgi:hypothetical protein
MPQSANFSVQNALKLTYKHPEIPKNFLGSLSLAIKGKKAGGGEGRERKRRRGKEEGYSPSKNVCLSSPLVRELVDRVP